jgi:endonuclease-3
MSDLKQQIKDAASRLEKHQGRKQWGSAQDPVALLVETILSHNTNDRNRDMAFQALQSAYPSWQNVIDTDHDDLALTIRSAGLNHQKAERIQFVLQSLLAEQGEFTLKHYESMSVAEALEAITQYPGIGKKTAGIVLTFGLNKPYFAVDTHINRISRRIGWVQEKEDAHDVMNILVPNDQKGQFHMQLIQHGRETCKARKPLCDVCVLQDMCQFFQSSTQESM